MADTTNSPLPVGHEMTGHPAQHAPTVYGSAGCEDSLRSRAFLDTLGVEYNYYDVDLDPAMARTASALQGGGQKTPVIDFHDGTVLVEPTNDALAGALRREDGVPHHPPGSV